MQRAADKSSNTKRVAVIGGGITGLSAAYRLTRKHQSVVLFEAGSRTGGSIHSLSENGWLCEVGPNTLLEGEPELDSIIDELGLRGERIEGGASSKNRYIVRDSRLCALPMSPPSLISSKLFSAGTKIRLFTELLQRPRTRPEDVSLARMIEDHFGREAVDYGLNPFVSGVYAGDPSLLSAKFSFPKLWEIEQTKGSIIRGQIAAAKQRKSLGRPKPKIISFKKGLRTIVDALAAAVPTESIRLDTAVRGVFQEGNRWRVVAESKTSGLVEELVDAVVCALPAHGLARLAIGAPDAFPLNPLGQIAHPPVTSLFLGYRREQVAHPLDGFGALIPAVEKRNELGILFSSSLFQDRAPDGHVALTVMVGGMRQPEIGRLSQDELLDRVTPDLRELLGVSGVPVFLKCHQWPMAIPQYNLGYGRFLEMIEACEKANPGLHIGGNARDGIAVPSCLVSGLRLGDAAGA